MYLSINKTAIAYYKFKYNLPHPLTRIVIPILTI